MQQTTKNMMNIAECYKQMMKITKDIAEFQKQTAKKYQQATKDKKKCEAKQNRIPLTDDEKRDEYSGRLTQI